MVEASSRLLGEVIEVVRIAGKVAPGVAVDADKCLVDDLGIDSLDLVGVFLSIQDRYDVVIDDEDVPCLRRVSDLAAYVERNRGEAA
jgi:acyl carrier protein